MAIVMIDGFDLYNGIGANTGMQSKWVYLAAQGASAFSLVSGRFGGQAARAFTAGSLSNARATMTRSLGAGYASFSCGFSFRRASNNTVTYPIILFLNGTTYQIGLSLSPDGTLNAGRYTSVSASTTLGSSASGTITTNVWHYIEIEATINDTTGVFRVKVDGSLVINLSNVDTRNGTPTTVDNVEIGYFKAGSEAGANFDYDDIYVTDSATSLGERRVETLRPAADTAQKDFTRSAGSDNFALVDETLSNGDTDYVQGSTVGNLDRYTIGALSSTPSAISAVQLTAFALKTDAATRNIALHCRSGATDSDGPNYALAASYGKFDRILETDPATSAAWTSTGVNSLLIGPKVTV